MLGLTLKDQIYTFVKQLLLVEERQVKKFFKDWGPNNVEFELYRLKTLGYIHQIGTRLTTVRRLPTAQRNYDALIRAIDVMCYFSSQDVNYFSRDEWPVELTFVTTDNIIYDVTVFSSLDLVGKYAMIPKTRQRSLPDSEYDPVNHVAVVEDKEMALKVDPLGFSVFAVVDRNGNVTLYS